MVETKAELIVRKTANGYAATIYEDTGGPAKLGATAIAPTIREAVGLAAAEVWRNGIGGNEPPAPSGKASAGQPWPPAGLGLRGGTGPQE